MEMAVNRFVLLMLVVFSTNTIFSQDNLLKRKISLDMHDQSLENILLEVSDRADFTFSYNASILNNDKKYSIHSDNELVKDVLDRILPKNIQKQISGNHLILLKSNEPEVENEVLIEGMVYNDLNNKALNNIVVFEVNSLASDISDANGHYQLEVPIKSNQLALSFTHKDFKDTVIFLQSKKQKIDVSLLPVEYAAPFETIQPQPLKKLDPIGDHPLVRELVPKTMLERTANTGFIQERFFQVSIVPGIGSNHEMSGLVRNKLSLNVFSGYSYAVGAFELGGLANITHTDVNGFQIAGLANYVGETTKGVQIAGILNRNNGSMYGFQISGISNKGVDTLKGVQIAGIRNRLIGTMKGLQIAGINNFATKDVDGVQIAGISNISRENVKNLQLSGLLNYGKNIEGLQFSGLINLAAENVKGIQFAGLMNIADKVSNFQFAGLGNFSSDSVLGNQYAGLFNVSKYTRGGQLALFNFSDSTSGTPVGILSFVTKGFREVEFSSRETTPVNIAFKSGVNGFYNIFTAGIGNWDSGKQWMVGYGVGGKENLSDRWVCSIEYTANWVSERRKIQDELSLLNIFDFNFAYKSIDGFSVSLGPSLNLWLSEWKEMETGDFLSDLAPYTMLHEEVRGSLFQAWIGAKVAVHL